jgi:hypothetical protein
VQTEGDEVMHIVDRTSKALQFYAATGNIKQLLFVQRINSTVPYRLGLDL